MKYAWIIIFFINLSTTLFSQEINRIDSLGRKQGKWIEYSILPSRFVTYSSNTEMNYAQFEDIVYVRQEGGYKDGLKEGSWTKIYSNEKFMKDSVTYCEGVLNGDFMINIFPIIGNDIPDSIMHDKNVMKSELGEFIVYRVTVKGKIEKRQLEVDVKYYDSEGRYIGDGKEKMHRIASFIFVRDIFEDVDPFRE